MALVRAAARARPPAGADGGRRRMSQEIEPADPSVADARRLVHVSDAMPGIRRVRHNGGFAYRDPQGAPLRDRATLARIARLAIPPAYEDVWICVDADGHLQATGRDARGRKQYRYHAAWRQMRDGQKFRRMPDFADALPRLRRRLRADLAHTGMPREKVLAVVVSLLDATHARVGNAEYARENGSYGLATLQSRHVRFEPGGTLVLRFRGKGGVPHAVAIDDKRLARLIRHCHELPGQPLFQYVDEAGELRPVDSGQVNEYLSEAMGDGFTAKDFRTWAATLRAVALLRATPLPDPPSEHACKSCIVAAIRAVAEKLHNTPAVCRKSYINPLVFDLWRSGALHRALGEGTENGPTGERRAAAFLRREARRAGRVAVVAVAARARRPSTSRLARSAAAVAAAGAKKRGRMQASALR